MHVTTIFRRIVLLLFLGLLIGSAVWYFQRPNVVSDGLFYGNGRLEATEVDVSTKLAGKLASVIVDEGDDVSVHQIIADLEANELQAQLHAAEMQIVQAQQSVYEAETGVASAESQHQLANLTLERINKLFNKHFVSKDQLDQARSSVQVTEAALDATKMKVRVAQAAVDTAKASAAVIRTTIEDTRLKSPISGRVLYRLSEPGEVLASGSKVFTLLNMNDVFMSVYLSASDAGKIRLGSPARIVLDALTDPIPAKIVYVAPRAQFTPKEVETRNEREKLMFRVKAQIDSVWLEQHADLAKPGMPGVVWMKTSADIDWPAQFPAR